MSGSLLKDLWQRAQTERAGFGLRDGRTAGRGNIGTGVFQLLFGAAGLFELACSDTDVRVLACIPTIADGDEELETVSEVELSVARLVSEW